MRPHRALDHAKAERDWTTNNTKLKALTTVLTQEKVVITLPQYRAYHEQYDKRSAKLKELGTHNKESVASLSEDLVLLTLSNLPLWEKLTGIGKIEIWVYFESNPLLKGIEEC